MTISALQNWKGATTASSVASLTDAYTSNPTSGNAVVVFATRELGTGTLSISDDFGDGVGWTTIKGPIAAPGAAAIIIYGFWKVAGTCVGKTVTITNSTNTSLAIYVAEYKSDVAGTWALNGSATSNTGSSTTPDPGAITCDANPSVVIGYQSNDGGTANGCNSSWLDNFCPAAKSGTAAIVDHFLDATACAFFAAAFTVLDACVDVHRKVTGTAALKHMGHAAD